MATKKRLAIGLIGGTGYGSGELLRLLAHHPDAEVIGVTSQSQTGASISTAHPHLKGIYSLSFTEQLDIDRFADYSEGVIFLALPHGKSPDAISRLIADKRVAKLKMIDFSGDLRLQNAELRKQFYPDSLQLGPELVSQFAYGLTEINREKIAKARFVANPGCLATAAALAVLPVVQGGFNGNIAFDGKTGTSGAGRSAQDNFHHPERHANLAAYKILQHRHEPEILQALGDAEGKRLQPLFVPHLIPISRGIFVTAYLTLEKEANTQALLEEYRKYYQAAPFVRVVDGSPELHAVVGSNYCDVSVVVRGKQVVAMAAIDNLGKGMAGQAIENMNLMCGLEQTTGLRIPGMGLV